MGTGATVNNKPITLGSFSTYIKYRWRAKGRHGTHSPFVYAFVEDVLHDKRNFYATDFIRKESIILDINPATALFLFKALHYLQPEVITLTGRASKLKDIVRMADKSIAIRENSTTSHPDKNAWILYADEASTSIIGDIFSQAGNTAFVLLIDPHSQEKLWQDIINKPEIDLSLDCWKAGVLMKDNSFKAKQHFMLR